MEDQLPSKERCLYEKNGYVIVKGAISKSKIIKFKDSLELHKSLGSIYYSQSHHNWRRMSEDLDEFGLLTCSVEKFTDTFWLNPLKKLGRDILLDKNIKNILCSVRPYREWVMYQNMIFDKSTSTVDHIDSYYLDTIPAGELVGAWIALEGITGEGGAFRVYPGSHKYSYPCLNGLSHDDFIDIVSGIKSEYCPNELLVEEGDIILWHPRLIHGSSGQAKEGISRKSITAHYYPSGFVRGGNDETILTGSAEYQKLAKKHSGSRKIGYAISERLNPFERFIFSGKGLLKSALGGRRNLEHTLMDSSRF